MHGAHAERRAYPTALHGRVTDVSAARLPALPPSKVRALQREGGAAGAFGAAGGEGEGGAARGRVELERRADRGPVDGVRKVQLHARVWRQLERARRCRQQPRRPRAVGGGGCGGGGDVAGAHGEARRGEAAREAVGGDAQALVRREPWLDAD